MFSQFNPRPLRRQWGQRALLAAVLAAGAIGAAILLLHRTPPAGRVIPPAQGKRYYVATTGSDRNPCTQAAPCADMIPFSGGGAHQAQPGDEIIWQSGTYLMSATNPVPVIKTDHVYGTATAPITMTANGPVTITRGLSVTGTVTDAEQNTDLIDLNNGSYLTLTGPFIVIGAKNQPGFNSADEPYGGEIQIENHGGATPEQANGYGITISGVTVRDADNTCIKTQDSEWYDTFTHNTLINCGHTGFLDHGIYVSGPYNLIASNVISGAGGWGIQANGLLTGTQILSNTVAGSVGGGGIVDTNVGGAIISGNVVYDNHLNGLDLRWNYAGHGTDTTTPATVTQNIIASNGNSGGGSENVSVSNGPGLLFFAHNTLYQPVGGPEFRQPNGPITQTIEDTIFYGADPVPGTSYTAPWRSISSADLTGGGNVVDYNAYRDERPIYNCRANYPGGCNNRPYDRGHSLPYGRGDAGTGGHDGFRGTDPLFVGGSITPIPGGPSLPDFHLQARSPARGAGINLGPVPCGNPTDLGALPFGC